MAHRNELVVGEAVVGVHEAALEVLAVLLGVRDLVVAEDLALEEGLPLESLASPRLKGHNVNRRKLSAKRWETWLQCLPIMETWLS